MCSFFYPRWGSLVAFGAARLDSQRRASMLGVQNRNTESKWHCGAAFNVIGSVVKLSEQVASRVQWGGISLRVLRPD